VIKREETKTVIVMKMNVERKRGRPKKDGWVQMRKAGGICVMWKIKTSESLGQG